MCDCIYLNGIISDTKSAQRAHSERFNYLPCQAIDCLKFNCLISLIFVTVREVFSVPFSQVHKSFVHPESLSKTRLSFEEFKTEKRSRYINENVKSSLPSSLNRNSGNRCTAQKPSGRHGRFLEGASASKIHATPTPRRTAPTERRKQSWKKGNP